MIRGQTSFKKAYSEWADNLSFLPIVSGLALNSGVYSVNQTEVNVSTSFNHKPSVSQVAVQKDSASGWEFLVKDDLNSLRKGWSYRKLGQSLSLDDRVLANSRSIHSRAQSARAARKLTLLKQIGSDRSNAFASSPSSLPCVRELPFESVKREQPVLLTELSGELANSMVTAHNIKLTRASAMLIAGRSKRAGGDKVCLSQNLNRTEFFQYAPLPAKLSVAPEVQKCACAYGNEQDAFIRELNSSSVKLSSRTRTVPLSMVHPAESIINQGEAIFSKETEMELGEPRHSLHSFASSFSPLFILGRRLRKGSSLREMLSSRTRSLRGADALPKTVNSFSSSTNVVKKEALALINRSILISLCGVIGYLPAREMIGGLEVSAEKKRRLRLIVQGTGLHPLISGVVSEVNACRSSLRSKFCINEVEFASSSLKNDLNANPWLSVSASQLGKLSTALRTNGHTAKVESFSVKATNKRSSRQFERDSLSSSANSFARKKKGSVWSASANLGLGLAHSFPYTLAVKAYRVVSRIGSKRNLLRGRKQSVPTMASSIVMLSEKAVYSNCVKLTTNLLKELAN